MTTQSQTGVIIDLGQVKGPSAKNSTKNNYTFYERRERILNITGTIGRPAIADKNCSQPCGV